MMIRFTPYILILWIFQLPLHAKSHYPQEFLHSISETKDEGEQIYKHFCINCHASKPLISIGAPRIGDEGDWAMRMKQGMNVLFNHTNEGLNGMPSRGGCFECSDKQLMRTILFMLPKHLKKNSK